MFFSSASVTEWMFGMVQKIENGSYADCTEVAEIETSLGEENETEQGICLWQKMIYLKILT